MSSVLCIFSILGSSSAAISIACHEQRVAQSRVPGSRLACAARRRVQLKGACDHGRGPGYPARLRQQVGTFLVGLDCLERVRRVRLQPAHRRTGTGTSRWRAECWRSAESSHPVLISS